MIGKRLKCGLSRTLTTWEAIKESKGKIDAQMNNNGWMRIKQKLSRHACNYDDGWNRPLNFESWGYVNEAKSRLFRMAHPADILSFCISNSSKCFPCFEIVQLRVPRKANWCIILAVTVYLTWILKTYADSRRSCEEYNEASKVIDSNMIDSQLRCMRTDASFASY